MNISCTSKGWSLGVEHNPRFQPCEFSHSLVHLSFLNRSVFISTLIILCPSPFCFLLLMSLNDPHARLVCPPVYAHPKIQVAHKISHPSHFTFWPVWKSDHFSIRSWKLGMITDRIPFFLGIIVYIEPLNKRSGGIGKWKYPPEAIGQRRDSTWCIRPTSTSSVQ